MELQNGHSVVLPAREFHEPASAAVPARRAACRCRAGGAAARIGHLPGANHPHHRAGLHQRAPHLSPRQRLAHHRAINEAGWEGRRKNRAKTRAGQCAIATPPMSRQDECVDETLWAHTAPSCNTADVSPRSVWAKRWASSAPKTRVRVKNRALGDKNLRARGIGAACCGDPIRRHSQNRRSESRSEQWRNLHPARAGQMPRFRVDSRPPMYNS